MYLDDSLLGFLFLPYILPSLLLTPCCEILDYYIYFPCSQVHQLFLDVFSQKFPSMHYIQYLSIPELYCNLLYNYKKPLHLQVHSTYQDGFLLESVFLQHKLLLVIPVPFCSFLEYCNKPLHSQVQSMYLDDSLLEYLLVHYK